ncbi:ribosome maturation factor RimM [Sandarakinorhabdus rubra]|uniref:ribosome maturation factor RimM n=1 Tax=Sandarakinorhabdus rubra TaxID=2672568 RepID=UPI0013DCBE3E|nr:ribosome maturation factor RimM [Sandarakinorhabdus rubra]
MAATRIVLAAIAGAHGIRGEVRVKLFTGTPDSLARHARFDAGGRALVVQAIRPDKPGMAVARFEGISDRNAAEALRGLELAVPRSELPPLAEGEYYVADYIGMAVVDETGEPFGRVKAIENYGASDILDIARDGGGSVMVPFVADVVREEPGCLVIDRVWLA